MDEIDHLFTLQHTQENLFRLRTSSSKARLNSIISIADYLCDQQHQKTWLQALYDDLHKNKEEALLTELAPILTNVQHIKKYLSHWMKPQRVKAPLILAGLHSHVHYEAKGHVLIISPWNYPLQLSITPVIYALAAGNSIVLKPSEMAAHTSAFLASMFAALFDQHHVAVVEGGIPEATHLLDKPFQHIFFTGSPSVGKRVMQAASQHLASVTLELGGKSPVIVDETINDTAQLKRIAKKIAFGKSLNAGQTCIAPDYLYIHESHQTAFCDAYREAVQALFPIQKNPLQKPSEIGWIINSAHHNRLQGLINDALAQGAKLEECTTNENRYNYPQNRYLPLSLLTHVTPSMQIMQEEVFGPILPVVTYQHLDEVIKQINSREKPLAIYIMSYIKANIDYIIQQTSAGGTAINDTMITSINPYLPFGGINGSGIGKSNGVYSFIEFSNQRGVIKRQWGTSSLLYPPYKKSLLNGLLKWLKR